MRFFIVILMVLIISPQVFAYSVKIYNKQGAQMGTAKKIEKSRNYKFFDMNGKEFNPNEQIYSPVGTPLQELKNDPLHLRFEYRNSDKIIIF